MMFNLSQQHADPFSELRAFALTLCVLLLAALLSSCGGNRKSDLVESGEPSPLPDFVAEARLKRQWSVGIGNGQGKYYDRLTLGFLEGEGGAEDVVVAAVNGSVGRFDARGKRVWRSAIGKRLSAGVGANDSMVLVADSDGVVHALNAENGKPLWQVDVRSEVLAAPIPERNSVLVQTGDGRLLCLAAEDGSERWVYNTDLPLLTSRGTATPVVRNGVVYTGFATGKFVALDLQTGSLRWDKLVALAKGQAEIERIVDIDAAALVTTNAVYVSSFNGNLFAFDRNSGSAQWRFETSSYREVAQGFGNVYLVDEDSRIHAISADEGELRWEQSALLHRQLSAPAVFEGFLLVADDQGYLHIVSQVDGAVVGRARVDGSGVRVPMRVANDALYVYSNDGKLAAYSLQAIN